MACLLSWRAGERAGGGGDGVEFARQGGGLAGKGGGVGFLPGGVEVALGEEQAAVNGGEFLQGVETALGEKVLVGVGAQEGGDPGNLGF